MVKSSEKDVKLTVELIKRKFQKPASASYQFYFVQQSCPKNCVAGIFRYSNAVSILQVKGLFNTLMSKIKSVLPRTQLQSLRARLIG